MLTQNDNNGSAPKTMRATRLLVDSKPVRMQLVEGAAPGKVIMRGEFARCDQATENKRVYPKRLWERELNRLGKAMQERQLYGELDHPSDGRTQLTRASHLITNLEIKDGIVYGEAEVLDTDRGRNLKAILQAGGVVGISSRGMGETRTNEKGEEVVQDNYRLMTFDFVADPADQHAFPEVFYEHKEGSMDQETEAKLAEDFAKKLAAAKQEGREGAEATLREEFARETLAHLATLRAQVTEQVRGELLSDPTVAGARTALEAIKSVLRPFVLPEDAKAVAEAKDAEIEKLRTQLAEMNLQMKDLLDENTKLGSVAKEAGYKFFVERQIAGDPDADLVRKLIGDVKVYENSEALKSKIESVRTDLATKREREHKLSEQIESEKAADRERKERERARALKAEQSLREENEKLRTALDKSLEANKQLMVSVYTESRLTNHPKAAKIRSIIESSQPTTRQAVDSIIERFREAPQDVEQLESVRARVRKATNGGIGPTALEEETAVESTNGSAFFNGLGVSLTELKNLSGMHDNQPLLSKVRK